MSAPIASVGALLEQAHQMDVLDASFAHLAPGYPDTSNPGDYAASVAAGFVSPVEWDAPVQGRRTEDTPTGGRL